MTNDWLVVLTADGCVLAVDRGAPLDWVGTQLGERSDIPEEIRRSVQQLLVALHSSVAPMAVGRAAGPSDQAIELIAIEAVPLRRASVDVRALLESVVRLMQPQASAIDLEVTLTADADLPRSISLDPDKIGWVVATLVGNAMRYVRRGSRLMPGGLVSVSAVYEPTTAEITIVVQDDGLGVPTGRLRSIFDRSPDDMFSAGLGLSMIQDVVAAHGGRLDITSLTDPVRHGTTIRLTFPVLG
jgi:signal transduction histidine kinase